MTDDPQVNRSGKGRLFKFLWTVDAIVALILVAFFLIGLSDGSVSSFNLGLWCTILAVVAGVLFGSFALRRAGYRRWAMLLALVLAAPGLLYALFMLVVLVDGSSWN